MSTDQPGRFSFPRPTAPDRVRNWIDTRGFTTGLLLLAAIWGLQVTGHPGAAVAVLVLLTLGTVVNLTRTMPPNPVEMLLDANVAMRCNTRMAITIDIRGVLNHRATESAFGRLKQAGRIDGSLTWEAWRDQVLADHIASQPPKNYDAGQHTVTFQFKGGQLYIDGEWQRIPVVQHQIVVSSNVLADAHTQKYAGHMDVECSLVVRVVLVNGILKLQLGNWDEEAGTPVDGDPGKWRRWDTITSFPLLLNPLSHYLPPRVLMLDWFVETGASQKRWRRDRAVWRGYVRDYCQALGNPHAHQAYKRLDRAFGAWLKREGFPESKNSVRTNWYNGIIHVGLYSVQKDYTLYKYLGDVGSQWQ